MEDIKGSIFQKEVEFYEFEKLDKYFRQFYDTNEIFADLSSKKKDEIKVEEIDNNIKLILQYKIRNEKKDISFILTKEEDDINKIVMNLCEKSKELDMLKKENENLKQQIAELQYFIRWIYKKSEKPMPTVEGLNTSNWIKDSKIIDWKELDIQSERYGRVGSNIF